MKKVEYFPGANTPQGFYSYYDEIMSANEANRIIILKGGPGCGKSTFMKKIANKIEEKGEDCELLHCSSDPDSLDGVVSRNLGFVILDGTSPHIVDPKYPAAVEEIINLGECWDKEAIKKNKLQIIETSQKISQSFSLAYRHLDGAKRVDNEIREKLREKTNVSGINKKLTELFADINEPNTKNYNPNERKAFLSAITHKGRVNYIDTFSQNAKTVYKIKAKNKESAKFFMDGLRCELIKRGQNLRSFYCPMSPDEVVEHIFSDDVFFSVSNLYSDTTIKEGEIVIDLDDGEYPRFAGDYNLYELMISKAKEALKNAKELHDRLEKFYIPYMDFEKVEKKCDEVVKSL